ncbi:MAG: flagellin [Parvularculaceae bacterium]
MTRISDLGFQQLLLAGFQRAQDAAQRSQAQLSSGKIANSYGGIGAATGQLLSAEGVVSRATAYVSAANVATSRLQVQESSLSTVAESVALIRARFVTTLATGSPELLLPEIEVAAGRIISALNTQLGGVFVFGGVDGSAPPVQAMSLADIGAAANTDALLGGGPRARLPVEEGSTVDGGATALEIASELFAELKELANAESVYGPFTGQLTAAQRDFLLQKVARLDAISADFTIELGLNGIAQSQAHDAKTRNVQRRDLAEIVASEIEDVDIAEAIARLNQDQLAVEAAGRALVQATQLSLLNYI